MSRLVVIGASAGGVDALLQFVRKLPADFAAPIFIVVHLPADTPSLLPSILSRAGKLEARHPEDGERYKDGVIYVAPPDRHLLIGKNGTLRTVRGPRENRHRPSIDPLFRSAAIAGQEKTIGVVLTGSLDDGTAGMVAIKKAGGIAIVQDPEDAIYPSMPRSVMEHVKVDYITTVDDLAALLVKVLSKPAPARSERADAMRQMDFETRIAAMDAETMNEDDRPGQPSAFSCPDCGGVLWEIEDGEMTRFRCRVGHAFSPETMLGAQSDVLEQAMYTAYKTLEESARLSKRLAMTERSRGHEWMAKRFEEREAEARERADTIRRFLLRDNSTTPVEVQ